MGAQSFQLSVGTTQTFYRVPGRIKQIIVLNDAAAGSTNTVYINFNAVAVGSGAAVKANEVLSLIGEGSASFALIASATTTVRIHVVFDEV